MSALWRQIINSQHDSIALITDHRGDVLHHNDGFATMSPHTPPHNVFRWTLLSPEAREGTLRDWAGTWAQAAAFHLQLSQLTHPDDTRLTDLVSEVVCDPIAGPLYARVDHTRAFAAETWRLQHAQWGPGYVQMASAQPSSSHPTTVVFMPFHGTRL
ncbi:MmyB family transcriptional regulator [Streptomyces sp. NBC_01497]|uniref:MmyB family transcriptional regulator n=1 Tax=Streptomyces sp. NBC_01497 TaxID=2903885 RepID=UPI002E359AD6|nr:hypothetical protein [Streptomyces sp. NBC_01497]